MADVTNFDALSEITEDLTESQVRVIIRRIELNIVNIYAGKWDAVDYAEFGAAGHRKDTSKMLAEMRAQHEYWTNYINEIPAWELTQWDSPAV